MDVCIDQVEKGDFVHGFGTVAGVKYFYQRVAVRGRTANNERRGLTKLDYVRLVSEQQEEGSYSEILDSVQIFGKGNLTKTFSADKIVSIYRLMKRAV
jgi:hypothetical protein